MAGEKDGHGAGVRPWPVEASGATGETRPQPEQSCGAQNTRDPKRLLFRGEVSVGYEAHSNKAPTPSEDTV